jgi:hypothetical protein
MCGNKLVSAPGGGGAAIANTTAELEQVKMKNEIKKMNLQAEMELEEMKLNQKNKLERLRLEA